MTESEPESARAGADVGVLDNFQRGMRGGDMEMGMEKEMGMEGEEWLAEACRVIERASRTKADNRSTTNDKAANMAKKRKSHAAKKTGPAPAVSVESVASSKPRDMSAPASATAPVPAPARPAAKRASDPCARTKSRLRIFEWQATKGTRAGWLAAIELEDFEEVKRLSLAGMQGYAPTWKNDAKAAEAAEASASWINAPLSDDLVAKRDLTIFLRRHPGHPDVEGCLRLHAHLCATPLELAMVMGKESLLRAIKEEWARGRRHRDGRPVAPRWLSSAGPMVEGWHRLDACPDMRVGFGETGVALGCNLFLWAYMSDRAAYRALVRMGFCEEGFLRGFAGELRTVESADLLLRSFGRPKGRHGLDPVAIERFVEKRRNASWKLREAMLELERRKDLESLRKVRAALAKAPFVAPGCLSAAANADSKEVLATLLAAGANPNGWVGGAICDWSGAVGADPELHHVWLAHGGNPFMPSGAPLGYFADRESVMRVAIRQGRALTVEAFLRLAGEDWPLTAEDAERLAHDADSHALEWPHLASALAIIARLLREEPRRAAAKREREALASSTEERGRSSSARRL